MEVEVVSETSAGHPRDLVILLWGNKQKFICLKYYIMTPTLS
jgi:hypothetical protein